MTTKKKVTCTLQTLKVTQSNERLLRGTEENYPTYCLEYPVKMIILYKINRFHIILTRIPAV